MRKFSILPPTMQPPTTSLSEFELTVKSMDDPGQVNEAEQPFKYSSIQEADPFLWRAKNPRLNTTAAILVVVTMYNEGGDELLLTLRAIAKNVKQMTRRLRRPTFWQSIAVVIVSDGRSKASSSTLQVAKELGILNAAVMAKAKPTTQVHLFESIVKMVDNEARGTRFPPLQVLFAMKERNSGKLNSHLWFFEGFAHVIQPKYTFLLDVGTVPRDLSFLGFYNELENNDNAAGVCGRLTTRSNHPIEWLNPVISAQRFEYQVSSLLDLSFQSILGYLAVLPGAFSAYRYEALRGEPLRQYFSQLGVADRDLNPFVTNMTLAEDRLLCYELISKKDCSYTLSYVNTAVAETDVPSDLVALLKQRRRWLNGSLFALLYALAHFFTFWGQSGHTLYRKFCISFLYFFFAISVTIQWLAMGMFFLVIVLVSRALGVLPIFYVACGSAFLIIVIVQFVLSIQNRPQDLRIAYNFTSAILSVITVGLLVLIVQFALVQFRKGDILLILTFFIAWGVYLAAGLLHGAFVAICLSLLPFVAMTPAFLIVFPIFALSNTHDVSWGTKDLNTVAQPSDEATKEIVRRRFQRFRTLVVGLWLLSNIILVILVFYFDIADAFLLVTILSVLFLNGARFIGSVLYLTGGSANSSLFVKFFVSPITIRAYMALLKLPFSLLASFAYMLIMLFTFFLPDERGKKLIHSVSAFEIRFTHALSSRSSVPTKKALASLEVRKDVHYVVKNDENRRLDLNKNRRYFLLFRWMVTSIIAIIWILFVDLTVIVASLGRKSIWFRCAASCTNAIAKLNLVPFQIPALVAALFVLNIAWAGDDIIRMLAVKQAPIQ